MLAPRQVFECFVLPKKAACVRKSSLIDLAASILHWKDASFVFPVLQGSAETLLRRGGNYTIFPVPGRKVSKKVYFLRNLPAENYYFSDAYSSYR